MVALAVHIVSRKPISVIQQVAQAVGVSSYVLSPDVDKSASRVTLVLSGSASFLWSSMLSALGQARIDTNCASLPSASILCRFWQNPPPLPPVRPARRPVVLSYRPVFRSVSFLGSQVDSVLKGCSSDAGGIVSAPGVQNTSVTSGGGMADQGARSTTGLPSLLVMACPVSLSSSVLPLLHRLDVPAPSLVVRAAVFELDAGKSSAASLALALTAGGFKVSLPGAAPTGAGSVGLSAGGFTASVSALSSLSSVHLLTAPRLRVTSGDSASFAVGASVPTVSALAYPSSAGGPVQSVTYQQSGVLLSVVPVLTGSTVHLSLSQSVSQFAPTTTGVSSSPTLSNRSLTSSFVVPLGRTVVLGSLVQSQSSRSGNRFFFIPLGRSRSSSSTTLLVVLQVSRASS